MIILGHIQFEPKLHYCDLLWICRTTSYATNAQQIEVMEFALYQLNRCLSVQLPEHVLMTFNITHHRHTYFPNKRKNNSNKQTLENRANLIINI